MSVKIYKQVVILYAMLHVYSVRRGLSASKTGVIVVDLAFPKQT